MDVLDTVRARAFEHVEGGPADAIMDALAMALGRTKLLCIDLPRGAAPSIGARSTTMEDDVVATMIEAYADPRENPMLAAIARATAGRMEHYTRFASPETLRRTAFHADVWIPSALTGAGGLLTTHPDGSALYVAIATSDGRDWYDARETALATEAIGIAVRAIRRRATGPPPAAPDRLDGPGAAVLVDADLRILAATAAAGPAFDRMGLRSRDAFRLSPMDPEVKARLTNIVRAGAGCIVIGAEAELAILEVGPGLCPTSRRVELRHPCDPIWTPALLAEAFGTTPREGEVALALCRGLSIAEAAEAMGIGVPSARLYVKRALAKCDVHSQAQLVAKLRAF